jgi:hypothetical protein
VENMDNSRTLDMIGDEDVTYGDVVSGGTGMTMLARISAGNASVVELLCETRTRVSNLTSITLCL